MTPMQAFRIGRDVYGIQFHFEAEAELVADWSRDLAARSRSTRPTGPRAIPRRPSVTGARRTPRVWRSPAPGSPVRPGILKRREPAKRRLKGNRAESSA